MKKKIVRVLSLLLVAVTMCLCFASCGAGCDKIKSGLKETGQGLKESFSGLTAEIENSPNLSLMSLELDETAVLPLADATVVEDEDGIVKAIYTGTQKFENVHEGVNSVGARFAMLPMVVGSIVEQTGYVTLGGSANYMNVSALEEPQIDFDVAHSRVVIVLPVGLSSYEAWRSSDAAALCSFTVKNCLFYDMKATVLPIGAKSEILWSLDAGADTEVNISDYIRLSVVNSSDTTTRRVVVLKDFAEHVFTVTATSAVGGFKASMEFVYEGHGTYMDLFQIVDGERVPVEGTLTLVNGEYRFAVEARNEIGKVFVEYTGLYWIDFLGQLKVKRMQKDTSTGTVTVLDDYGWIEAEAFASKCGTSFIKEYGNVSKYGVFGFTVPDLTRTQFALTEENYIQTWYEVSDTQNFALDVKITLTPNTMNEYFSRRTIQQHFQFNVSPIYRVEINDLSGDSKYAF